MSSEVVSYDQFSLFPPALRSYMPNSFPIRVTSKPPSSRLSRSSGASSVSTFSEMSLSTELLISNTNQQTSFSQKVDSLKPEQVKKLSQSSTAPPMVRLLDSVSSDFLNAFIESYEKEEESENVNNDDDNNNNNLTDLSTLSSFRSPYSNNSLWGYCETPNTLEVCDDNNNNNNSNNMESPETTLSEVRRENKRKRQSKKWLKSEYDYFTTEKVLKKVSKTIKEVEEKTVEKVKTKKGLRKIRKNEWSSEEVVLLLLTTKELVEFELKTISQVLFEVIKRDPGKCCGRAAEKKLKRLGVFENWKTCDKTSIVQNIDKLLNSFDNKLSEEKQTELNFCIQRAKENIETTMTTTTGVL